MIGLFKKVVSTFPEKNGSIIGWLVGIPAVTAEFRQDGWLVGWLGVCEVAGGLGTSVLEICMEVPQPTDIHL